MNAIRKVWPICPRPQPDESLHSWFERIGYGYAMSPALLLGVVEQEAFGDRPVGGTPPARRLLDPSVGDRLAVLGQLSDSEITCLWPRRSGWELHDQSFSTICPHCCLGDLANNCTPYGRRDWQESWCTVCTLHGTPLMLRSIARAPRNRSSWSHATLKRDGQYLAANRYRDLKVPLQPAVRSTVLGCLLELERATAAAISGVAPNSCVWGKLTPQEFLMILRDLTTWALTHFEPVRSWSAAEDLTPTEEQEGYGLIGRSHRMSASDYRDDRSTRTLRDIANPKVRGAALWTAHALMAMCHVAASDRPSGKTTQDRQAALLSGSAPASRPWLAQCQANWPSEYRRSTCIDLNEGL